jgi:ribosome recycling factor
MLNDVKNDAQARMSKSIDSLRHDLTRIRTGRASTSLVDHIKVPYYGADTPLSQVASVSLADSRTINITPWEKAMVAPIEKALMASDIGITPTTAGTVIRLNMPALTEERRRELARLVGHEGENAKIAIRNVRRDALQQVKDLLKEKLITEDDDRRFDDEVQKLTDRAVKDVDAVVKAKEEELMAL